MEDPDQASYRYPLNLGSEENNTDTVHTLPKDGVIIHDSVRDERGIAGKNEVIRENAFQYELSADDVPDVVAAETVVMTTPPRSRHAYLIEDTVKGSPLRVAIFSPEEKASVLLDQSLDDVNVLTQFSNQNHVAGVDEVSESELNTSQESFVALAPETILMSGGDGAELTHVFMDYSKKIGGTGGTQHETKQMKLVRDRLKKRELRMNPEFRRKEQEKAKERMRTKRRDPNYRDVERKKDRIRRRISRNRTAVSKILDKGATTDSLYQKLLHKIDVVNVIVKGSEEDHVGEAGGMYEAVDISDHQEVNHTNEGMYMPLKLEYSSSEH